MPVTLLALWDRPADPEDFERRYAEEHLPLARRLPGLQDAQTYRVLGRDAAYYRVAALHFADVDALKAAMASAAGQELAADTQRLGTVTNLVLQAE